MRLASFQMGLARALICAVLSTGGAALAQTTGAVNPTQPGADSPAVKEPPPGGCMPIGLTASGEVVFPFQCKDFLDSQRSVRPKTTGAETTPPKDDSAAFHEKPVEQKPSVADDKPVDDKPAPAQANAVEGKTADTEAKPIEGKSASGQDKTAKETPASNEGKATEQSAAAVNVDEKAAKESSESVAPMTDKSLAEQSKKGRPSKRSELEARSLAVGPPGCNHFRSFDAASQTYKDYGGKTHPCR